MRSGGSRFSLGDWGCVCYTLRLRPQPFATARNCPQPLATVRKCPHEVATAVPMRSAGHFWRFQTLRNLVSCGKRGTLWHRNNFHNVSKVVLCDRRNTCARFSEDDLHGATLCMETSIVILRGRRSTLGVWCYMFFANPIVRAAWSRDDVQITWQACGRWWKLTEASHEISILTKLVGKSQFWSYKLWRCEEVLCEVLALSFPPVSSSFSVVFAALPWEAAKPLIFEGFKRGCNVVLGPAVLGLDSLAFHSDSKPKALPQKSCWSRRASYKTSPRSWLRYIHTVRTFTSWKRL